MSNDLSNQPVDRLETYRLLSGFLCEFYKQRMKQGMKATEIRDMIMGITFNINKVLNEAQENGTD